MLEGIAKIDPVLVAFKDGLSLVVSGGDMVDGAGVFYTERTGHVARISEEKGKVKH